MSPTSLLQPSLTLLVLTLLVFGCSATPLARNSPGQGQSRAELPKAQASSPRLGPPMPGGAGLRHIKRVGASHPASAYY